MKRLLTVIVFLSFLAPLSAFALGNHINHYIDDWAGRDNWHAKVYPAGPGKGHMRIWDEKYVGRSIMGPFQVQFDWTTPTHWVLKGRYRVSGPDGTFYGNMRLYFCSMGNPNVLCGDFIADHLGYRINLDTFDRF